MNGSRALVAEFLGTFYLCFAGIAAILATQKPIAANGGAQLLAIAAAHGLAIAIAVSVFGGISGAHVNPAVTVGMLSTGRISPGSAVGYIISQLLGATAAAFVCKLIFSGAIDAETGQSVVDSAKLGIPLPPGDGWVTVPVLLLAEFICTFLLVTSVFGTAVDERGKAVKIGGFAIGLTVAIDILACGTVTGASMNPARSFGPALVHGYWDYHVWYWIAPLAGGVAAALVYHHVVLGEESS